MSMLKSKLRRVFSFRNSPDIEFEAQVFGENKNNLSIVIGTERDIEANHVAFVLGYVLVEICKDSKIDVRQIMDTVYIQTKSKGGMN